MRRSRLAITLGLLVTLILAGCTKTETTSKKTFEVAVIHPVRRDAVRTITLPGDLVGYYEAPIYAKVTGYLEDLRVDKGDWVKKGQLLAKIWVPELEANLQRARARHQIDWLTWIRLKEARDFDDRLIAKETVDIAYAKEEISKANVHELEAMVGYTKIYAPFDGVITGRYVDPGTLIRAGGGDFGIAHTGAEVSTGALEGAGGHLGGARVILSEAIIDTMRVYVYTPEQESYFVHPGTPARIVLRAMPQQPIYANVTRIQTALDLATRTMLTEIDIKNPEHKYYPRMYADVTLELDRHPHAIQLPIKSVGGLAGTLGVTVTNAYVQVVENNRIRRVPVKTGYSDGRMIEITSGLRDDQMVAYPLDESLADGTVVKPVPIKVRVWGIEDGGSSRPTTTAPTR